MPWMIKHKDGTLMGICTNKPRDGNLLPDGAEEVHEFVEDDQNDPAYNVNGTAEIAAFIEKQKKV